MPSIGDKSSDSKIDEVARKEALEHIRQANFEEILGQLRHLSNKNKPKVLDVGCAHGWFIKAATSLGFDSIGIEPDSAIADQARAEGIPIMAGFFPDDLPSYLSFDIITFNDVFEHLTDPSQAASACFNRLNSDGLLAITLPNSKGILYSTARFLARLGIKAPLHRMWQYDLPSPHINYFHPAILARFLNSYGFQEVFRGSLLSITHKGLWQRLTYAGKTNKGIVLMQYALLSFLIPIINRLPSDISFQVFKRT